MATTISRVKIATPYSKRKLFTSAAAIIVLAGGSMLLTSCVTVSLSSDKGGKPAEAQFTPPPAPFKEIKTSDADHAWRNPKNGNTISYVSACGADPSLDSLRLSVLQGFDQQDNVKTKNTTFNDREAIETTADGKVDGVAVRIRAMVFKRNGCNFTLSYLGPATHFVSDEPSFDQFEQRFHVP